MSHWIWQNPNWPDFTWDAQAINAPLAEARLYQGKLLGMAEAFSSETQDMMVLQAMTNEVSNSSAIEGELLERKSLRSSVANRLGVKQAGIASVPDRYIEGVLDVILDATIHFDQVLTLERLCAWQAALFPSGYSGIRKICVGNLRSEGDMQIISGRPDKSTIHYVAPPQSTLANEMARFLGWFNQPPEIDGLIRAAVAHLWFELLHPFDDGNGRVGRSIIDMALAQDEKLSTRFYSLSSQIMAARKHYYQALQAMNNSADMDITSWLIWFLRCYTSAVKQSLSDIETIRLKHQFWQIHMHQDINQRQRKVLNKMLDKGKVGYEGGMTNRKYSAINKVSRATAYRELADLVDKGCFVVNSAKGRSVSYQIDWQYGET